MAATEKSSSKKSSTTAKKKSSTSAKATPAPTEEESASEKKGGLDLPLPAKVGESGETKIKGSGDSSASPASEKKEPAKSASDEARPERAPSATVEPEAIAEFAAQPAPMQRLLRAAIDLTRQNLTYTFGSADPEKGGMDCSGTIYHLLRAHGLSEVPRDSSGQYLWARKECSFFPVVSKSAETVELKELQPGDLMFWTGTYDTARDVPISHVMLYLGREKSSGKRIMFGASDGRSYNGVQRWGVSVFDFRMPKADSSDAAKSKVDFVGYARIPGLNGAAKLAAAEKPEPVTAEPSAKTEKAKATPAARSKSSRKKSESR